MISEETAHPHFGRQEELRLLAWLQTSRLRLPDLLVKEREGEAERRVAESRHLHDAIITMDADGRFVDANTGAERVDVRWDLSLVDGVSLLTLNWRESGLEGVVPPTRKGFGHSSSSI